PRIYSSISFYSSLSYLEHLSLYSFPTRRSSDLDYYFPETKGIDTSDSKVYFDMSTVLEPMENRSALEVEVAMAPLGKLYAKRFLDRKSTRLNSSHVSISYAVFCLKKKIQ